MLSGQDQEQKKGIESKETDPLVTQADSADAEVKFAYQKASQIHAAINNSLETKDKTNEQVEALNNLQALLLYYNRLYMSTWGLTKATTYVYDWHKNELEKIQKALKLVLTNNHLAEIKLAPTFSKRFFTTWIDPDLSWISWCPEIAIPEFAFLTGKSNYTPVAFLKGALYYSLVGLSLLLSALPRILVSLPVFVIRQIAKLVVTVAQAVLGVVPFTFPYIVFKHFYPSQGEFTNDIYRALRDVYKPWDRVLALTESDHVDFKKLDECIKAYAQMLKPSTDGELFAVHDLKLQAIYQLKALIGQDDGSSNDDVLSAISSFMKTGEVAVAADPRIKQVVENYRVAEQAKKNQLREGFSDITKYYQHKLFHDVRVKLDFGNSKKVSDEKAEEKAEAPNDFQLVAYKSALGVWQYRTISEYGVVSKPQFISLLDGGADFIAALQDDNDDLTAVHKAVRAKINLEAEDPKKELSVFMIDKKWMFNVAGEESKTVSSLTGGAALIPWLKKGKEGKLSPSQIATLERNIRQVVLSNQESTWDYARSYARYLWSEDHYQGKTVRGSLPLVKSEWEKDNLNFVQLLDTLAHMDTDGRYIDQIAQIIRAPGEFDKARQALLSKTLDSIFLDMQVKRYAQLSATDQVFFAKLNKRYAAEFEEKADVSKINLEFLKLANQKATTEGDREARKIAKELALALFGDSNEKNLTRKKFIHSCLAERDRVHKQKAGIQAELKRYKVAEHHLLEQLGLARHIKSNKKVDTTFFGHEVKYTFDEVGKVYVSEDKQETRSWKISLAILGLFVGIIVGLGEGVVAAFAMMTVMMLIVPIIFVGGALCNYFLMKGDTYSVLLDWFTKVEVPDVKKIWVDEKGNQVGWLAYFMSCFYIGTVVTKEITNSSNKRLVRKLWVDRDGNEVGALAYVMSFFGLAAFGTGIVYGCLSASSVLGLFGLSIGGLLTMMGGGSAGTALLIFAGVFLPAVSTAIAITSIYFIVIANFFKLGGIPKAWAALHKAFGNDELGKSFGESTLNHPLGFFTWERITYFFVSIIAEIPRLALALALSAIVILVGFILFKGNSTALLNAFGIGAGASEAAGFAFAGMNTASNVVFAFKKILAMIDLVWKKSFIQPLANLLISVLTIWCTNAFQQRLFGVVDAYVNSGHLAKKNIESEPALALLKIVIGLPLKLAIGALAFLVSFMTQKTAVMLISDVNKAVDSLVSTVWLGVKLVIMQPVFKLLGALLSALYWISSFGQKNRFNESFKAVDDVLGINQKEKLEVDALTELPNQIQSRSESTIGVKWVAITVGTLFNSTGQAFLMGGSIPEIPNFMNTTLGMTTMPNNMVLSMAIYPGMWVFSFGPNYIAYNGVIEGQKIGAVDGAYFTVKLAKDQDGELRYSAILSDGTELDSRSISELGKEASDKITLAYEDGVVTDEVRDLVVNAAAKQAEDHHNRKLTAPIAVGALFATMEESAKKDVVIRDESHAVFPALRAAC